MQAVLSPVGDPGMDRLHLALTAGALRLGQLVFEIAVEPHPGQLRPVRALRRRLVPEIDPDGMRAVGRAPLDRADDGAVPAAARILREIAGLKPALDLPVRPQPDLAPRNSAREPEIATSWFVNGIQPSERRTPWLTRQRSFGRPAFRRLVMNSSMISWITCEGRPSSLLAPLVRSRSCCFVAAFGPRQADRSLTSLQSFHTVFVALARATRCFPLVASFTRKLKVL